MTTDAWTHDQARALAVYFAGEALQETDRRGRPVRDDNFLLLFNAHHEPQDFRLPFADDGTRWRVLVDTAVDSGLREAGVFDGGATYRLEARALALLRQLKQPAPA